MRTIKDIKRKDNYLLFEIGELFNKPTYKNVGYFNNSNEFKPYKSLKNYSIPERLQTKFNRLTNKII